MKLKAEQLGTQLHNQLASVYIVSGDEPLQSSECCDAIRQKAREQGFTERHTFHVDNSFDWSHFLEAANSLSLFAEKQILELRMPGGKPGDRGRKALQEYLQTPSPDNLLLLMTDRLDASTQKAKWFQALEKDGVHVQVWPVEHRQLPGWIAHRFRMSGFEATPDAVSLLAERVEGNLLAAAQEIEKLKLLARNNAVDVDTVRDVVSDSARFDVFQLTDTALQGDVKNTVRILGGLRSEGIESPIVLWALAREIRFLCHLSRLKSRGLSSDQAIEQVSKAHGFSPFMQKKRRGLLEKSLGRLPERTLRQMLEQTGFIDQGIKGLSTVNEWDELLSLSMTLAGGPASPHSSQRLKHH